MDKRLLYFGIVNACFWFTLGMIVIPMFGEIRADVIEVIERFRIFFLEF